MGRLRAASIVCALALGVALGLSACGGDSAALLPGKTASEINQNLDQVRSFVAEGDCAGAESAVTEVSEEVDGLGNVDKRLKAALRQGADRLGEVVSSCGEEALAEAEAEREAEDEEIAEQEEQAAVEAEEEEFEAEDKAKKEKKHEPSDHEEKADEGEEAEPPETTGQGEGVENENEPPAETPAGTEPPAGGVGPGTEVE
jgi:cytochrome c1